MSESGGASFPGFGSKEIRNIPAIETVTGPEELPQATLTQADTGPEEVSVRQASLFANSLEDSLSDQSTCSLIRKLVFEELCRGLDRCSSRSERKGSSSSPTSQDSYSSLALVASLFS